ncbi:MAG: tRNA (adenosine(37)-N6)-threonylcarbamoyltransferase complex dimerization subunit type 1 TsaB [Candidatus Cloacimonetes bacterium]|nr:tRNA (adenosine(37)-N6)-threonylcarbamoyltransferase complex dimerization subunit type 1 TsaB [Candidatus Cloacimonadota bacterium]
MRVLALETTSTSGSVAVADETGLCAAAFLDIRVTHSERLMPQVAQCLEQAGLAIADIDLVAVSAGPGSFTGVRIGLATAKGLCAAREIPLWPVNTLDLLAHNAWGSGLPVLACIDARMDEVYAALYDTEMNPLLPPCNALTDEFIARVTAPAVLAVGSGALLYADKLAAAPFDVRLGLAHMHSPQATVLASLALALPSPPVFDWDEVAALEPYYLRRSQAEVALEVRERDGGT